jgi:carboxyl-terminal processing protease
MRLPSSIVVVVLLVAAGEAFGANDTPPPRIRSGVLSAQALRAQAEAAEREGRWSQALESYLQLFAEYGPSPELKDCIRHCLRHASRIRRYRDPHFQHFVVSLSISDALNLYSEVLEKLIHYYLEPGQSRPSLLFAHGLEELYRSLGDAQFIAAHLSQTSELRREQFRQSLRQLWKSRLPSSVREARQAARELVLASQSQLNIRTPAAIVFELICGACQGLDEFTRYQHPMNSPLSDGAVVTLLDSYGIRLSQRDRQWQIDKIVANSWAAFHAPVKAGDRLQTVNGQPVNRLTAEQLAVVLRAATYSVELEIESPGSTSVSVHLPVPAPTVYGVDFIQPKDRIGYLRISEFRETTPREVDEAILSLKVRGLRALIMDLRGNPGGLLNAGIEVSELFLPAGIILTTRGPSPEFANRVFSSDSGMTAYDFPLVVLIDSGTMSAAEIVALAMKDHERAVLVGMPSFGKGSIQASFLLQSGKPRLADSGCLIATVATMYGPRGTAVASGVMPHETEADPNRQLELAVARATELLAGPMPMMPMMADPGK